MTAALFVTRDFELSTGTEPTKLTLRVYQPTRQRTGEFRCAYEIRKGAKALRRFAINGEDSLQALLLALGAVVTEIEVLQGELNGRISAADWSDLRRLRPKRSR